MPRGLGRGQKDQLCALSHSRQARKLGALAEAVLLATNGQLSFAMSVSERSMYAHLLVDALLQMPTDQCQTIVEALRGLVKDPLAARGIDGHISLLWNGATCNDGLYDKDAAKRLITSLEDLCGLE
jgi:hypothetical protein